MAPENNDGPPQPTPASIQTGQENDQQLDNSVDIRKLYKVFKALDEIVKPAVTKREIMRNRQYYLATHPDRYKLKEEYQSVRKWTKDSKEYIVVRPCSVWVRDTDNPRPTVPDAPMPFEIKANLDRPVAIERIRELFKDLDDILKNKKSSNMSDDVEPQVTQRPSLSHPNLGRYQNDNGLSKILKRTRTL